MNKLEYQVRMAGINLFRSAEAFLGKPDYVQDSQEALPVLEQAAEETGHGLKVVAGPEQIFTFSRRSKLVGRSHKYFVPVAKDGILVEISRKVSDPQSNGFWGRVIELKAQLAEVPVA